MRRDLDNLRQALADGQPLTPDQLRLICEAIERLFQLEGWTLPPPHPDQPARSNPHKPPRKPPA